MGSQIYGFITIIFILLCLWFLAFIMTKFIGKRTQSAMRSRYMRVIDTMAMGFDKTLYLVKVGEQYILMNSSAKGFEFICTVNGNFSGINSEEDTSLQLGKGFSKYLDFFKPSTDTKSSSENNDIENNIERLKRMFNKKD